LLRVEARHELGDLLLDVEVAVERGRCLALAGPSGAGKTSLLRIAAGLLRPEHGHVTANGETWLDTDRGIDVPAEQRRCGYVFQHYALFPHLTAWQNVAYALRGLPRSERRTRATELLERFGLGGRADARPHTLSGGERQRVAVVRALARSPEVLLLDEPLNGLDPVQRRHVVELIRRLGSEGRTVLVSSHVLPEVERMAPRVVVLVNGRLVAEGETGAIRDLIRDRPRTVRIAAGAGSQALARELVGEGLATGVHIDDGVLVVETGDVDALGRRLMPIARDVGATLERIEPLGDDLESVYTYLTDHARGRGR